MAERTEENTRKGERMDQKRAKRDKESERIGAEGELMGRVGREEAGREREWMGSLRAVALSEQGESGGLTEGRRPQ